jgi:hypothetical protein
MLYCITELRETLWFIIERWIMCIDIERVIREEMEDEEFIQKMNR